MTGPFCSACGEKRITTHDYSLVHFAEHTLELFTHFDFKFLHSVKALIFHPGLLTKEHMEGRRKLHVNPLQLFVILNVLFALAAGLIDARPFSTPLRFQEVDGLRQARVVQEIEHRHITREEFTRQFDSTASVQAKTWVFTMIPVLALFISALYGFRTWLYQHLIFATHFLGFTFVLTLMIFVIRRVIVWGAALGGVAIEPLALDFPFSLGGFVVQGIYCYFAFRRAYGDGALSAALRGAAIAVGYFPILVLYRYMLFFITLWAMH